MQCVIGVTALKMCVHVCVCVGGGAAMRLLTVTRTRCRSLLRAAADVCFKLRTSEFNSLRALTPKINAPPPPSSSSSSARLLSSSSLKNRPGRGGLHRPSADPSKSTNGSYLLTPPHHPGGNWPTRLPITATLFSHLKPELFTRALGEGLQRTGGWEEERRGETPPPPPPLTSASNQSAEITAAVCGL